VAAVVEQVVVHLVFMQEMFILLELEVLGEQQEQLAAQVAQVEQEPLLILQIQQQQAVQQVQIMAAAVVVVEPVRQQDHLEAVTLQFLVLEGQAHRA
jgi:hypothetical protein